MAYTPGCIYRCNSETHTYIDGNREVDCPACKSERVASVASVDVTESNSTLESILGESRLNEVVSLAPGVQGETSSSSVYADFSLTESKIISPRDKPQLEPESVRSTVETVTNLYKALSSKLLPKESVSITLGTRTDLVSVAVPLLHQAYIAGFSVCPVVSAGEYRAKVIEDELRARNSFLGESANYRYPYMTRDVVVVLVPSGSTVLDISEVAGLITARSARSLPTIVLTHRAVSVMGSIGVEDVFSATWGVPWVTGVEYVSSLSEDELLFTRVYERHVAGLSVRSVSPHTADMYDSSRGQKSFAQVRRGISR